MLILLTDIDIVDSVVKFGVIDCVFSNLILLYLNGVEWMNEDVWKKVINDDLIEVIILGTTDVVVNSTRSFVLNEVELQVTIGTDE